MDIEETTVSPLTSQKKDKKAKKDHHLHNHNYRGSMFWRFFGKRVPRTQLVFICQILIIYVVIGSSIYNLSVGNKPSSLWIGLLASCLGYCLPNPSIDPAAYSVPYPPLPPSPTPPTPTTPPSPPTPYIYLKKREGETWV